MVSFESNAAQRKKEAGNTIRAKLNKPFTISLNTLPAAGYIWSTKYDSIFLKLENERFQNFDQRMKV